MGVQDRFRTQEDRLKRASSVVKDSEVAMDCRQHAKHGMVSSLFAHCARQGCSTLLEFSAEASPYCSHCEEASMNFGHSPSSSQILKQGYGCSDQGGHASEGGHPTVGSLEKRSFAMLDGRYRGEEDEELTAKKFRSGEGNVLMSSRPVTSGASQYADRGTRWCDVKVETRFSSG